MCIRDRQFLRGERLFERDDSDEDDGGDLPGGVEASTPKAARSSLAAASPLSKNPAAASSDAGADCGGSTPGRCPEPAPRRVRGVDVNLAIPKLYDKLSKEKATITDKISKAKDFGKRVMTDAGSLGDSAEGDRALE
eukprot:3399944-Alexandrium_andersonii.AAC.1